MTNEWMIFPLLHLKLRQPLNFENSASAANCRKHSDKQAIKQCCCYHLYRNQHFSLYWSPPIILKAPALSLHHASFSVKHRHQLGQPTDQTSFEVDPLNMWMKRHWHWMQHQEECWQDQCGVKLPEDGQRLHPGVVEGTSHFCFLRLHGKLDAFSVFKRTETIYHQVNIKPTYHVESHVSIPDDSIKLSVYDSPKIVDKVDYQKKINK